jgi:hypothetical protein
VRSKEEPTDEVVSEVVARLASHHHRLRLPRSLDLSDMLEDSTRVCTASGRWWTTGGAAKRGGGSPGRRRYPGQRRAALEIRVGSMDPPRYHAENRLQHARARALSWLWMACASSRTCRYRGRVGAARSGS